MSLPTNLNFSPDYNNVNNYSDDYQFDGVIFPKNAPLLAQDINEAQRILEATVTRFNSAIMSDGMVDTSEEWYADTRSQVTFKGLQCLICRGKVYYFDLSLSVPTENDKESIYAKLIVDRIVDSNSELYKYGNKTGEPLDNYLKDNFKEFEGKELSKRKLTIFETLFVSSDEPTKYEAEADTPGSGGEIVYVKMGQFHYGHFEPNYAVSLVPSKQGDETKEALNTISKELEELKAYQSEQLFNDFVSVKTVNSTDNTGAEIVTSTDKNNRVKVTTFVSEEQIVEVIKTSENGEVLGTKTITFVDENTITTVYS